MGDWAGFGFGVQSGVDKERRLGVKEEVGVQSGARFGAGDGKGVGYRG